MAKSQTIPVRADLLQADFDAVAALRKIDGYKSNTAELDLPSLDAAATALKQADEAFAQTEAAWQTARDKRVAAQWTFHNAMIRAKFQVVATYGEDSNEAQALGLVKKSERGRAKRNAQAEAPAPAL